MTFSNFGNIPAFFAVTFIIIILAAILIFVTVITSFIKRFRSFRSFGNIDVSSFDDFETRPRSLSGRDSQLLPKILKDFPDFNVTSAKSAVKEKLRETLSDVSDLKIHNVVINGYTGTPAEKTIIFQAALQFSENGKTVQKRYVLNYAFLIEGGEVAAANCPNCGAPIPGFSEKVCEYCGSRLVNVMGNTWKFTEICEG